MGLGEAQGEQKLSQIPSCLAQSCTSCLGETPQGQAGVGSWFWANQAGGEGPGRVSVQVELKSPGLWIRINPDLRAGDQGVTPGQGTEP